MAAQKLPYDKFLESFKLAPRLAIDLWIKNEDGAVLYLKRTNEPFLGMMHLPGTFLLLEESVKECLYRLCLEEVGIEFNGESKLRHIDEDLHEPRGHVVHLVYEINVNKKDIVVNENKQFHFGPPENLIPNHRQIFLTVS